jgi:large subunit ribosomal protein L24
MDHMSLRIKRNDRVEVIAGKDRGKQARVLRVIAERQRVLVEGVGMIKKHVKPNPQRNIKGGIAEQESPIHLSNVMLVDGDGKRTRVGTRTDEDRKVRVAKTTGAVVTTKAR